MMRRYTPAAILTISVALLAPRELVAHHGTLVAYDRDKQWTATAVVTEFRYVNPHVQLYFEVTDDKGKVTHWNGELLPNPAQLVANGWSRKRSTEALRPGTRVLVTAAPSRVGGPVVLVLRVRTENGEDLLGGSALPPAPPATVPRANP